MILDVARGFDLGVDYDSASVVQLSRALSILSIKQNYYGHMRQINAQFNQLAIQHKS